MFKSVFFRGVARGGAREKNAHFLTRVQKWKKVEQIGKTWKNVEKSKNVEKVVKNVEQIENIKKNIWAVSKKYASKNCAAGFSHSGGDVIVRAGTCCHTFLCAITCP